MDLSLVRRDNKEGVNFALNICRSQQNEYMDLSEVFFCFSISDVWY